jgi:inner membrane protein
MDPVSQGLLGSSLAGVFSKRKTLKKALFCGFIGGISPDLDIFIKSSTDPLLSIDYHRHFSHSIFFSPIGGFFVSLILFLLFKNKLSFKQIYLFSFLGFFSHGLLDACTSYGTILFWPFSDFRVGLNIISIIDPIFTTILLICFLTSLILNSLLTIRVGLTLCFVHLTFNFIKFEQVKSYAKTIAKERNHQIEKLLLNPTIGNNILWRSVYKHGDQYFVDAIYFPLFGVPKFKQGSKVKVINKDTVFPMLPENSIQRNDIKRFAYFSQDYIYLHPDYDNVIADLRYGMLPYDDKSLWGIEINEKEPNKHVYFKNIRNFDDKVYDKFWDMLKGNLD